MTIEDNVIDVRARIESACKSTGRNANEITLVAATKMQDVETVDEVAAAGLLVCGENRAQELFEKSSQCNPDIQWHFIGTVQRNKLKKIGQCVSLIQSVDDTRHIDVITQLEIPPEVLIQLSGDGDPSRGGVIEEEVPGLVEYARNAGLTVRGIMTVPPAGLDPRPFFDSARELGEKLGTDILSMGMTNDFEIAIEHGSSMIRVGSALFGARGA